MSLTLAPPRTSDQWTLRVGDHPPQLLQLALEQEAGVGGQQVGDPLGRRVSPMRRPEGVVDVDVGEAGEGRGQPGVVGGLTRLETAVLEQQHPARLELIGHRGGALADHLGSELDLDPEQLGEPLGHRLHRQRRIRLPAGTAEVGDEDQLGAVASQ